MNDSTIHLAIIIIIINNNKTAGTRQVEGQHRKQEQDRTRTKFDKNRPGQYHNKK